ncbi:MAG: hypothetical protein EA342_01995 [Leptolyngbya sp. LCM1.Bin17]|nr:MAG: hypothetical protein EA342_01995 [Leptolyngbya sp. LCM1.Bin17]
MFNTSEAVPVAPSEHTTASLTATRDDFSDYVAHLQLHMALQARNLVPSLNLKGDSRQSLLHQTQADAEKLASRQGL